MRNKTILVTGARGQLGTEIRNIAAGSPCRYVFSDRVESGGAAGLDITDIDAVRKAVSDTGASVIINCAAYTDVRKAESEPDAAMAVNCRAVENLSEAAVESGAVLVQVSTDYVFTGDVNVPYRESDRPGPVNVYGRTKLAGETAAMESGCAYLIFRTSWLYSPYGRNFFNTIRSLIPERTEINVVSDQTGCPTYAADLAVMLVRAAEKDNLKEMQGVYHYSNEGQCTWYDFAREIASLYGSRCRILPCTEDSYPDRTPRPAYSVLDKSKVKTVFGVEIPDWNDALKRCIQEAERLTK